MPPAPSDSPVGRASGPLGTARRLDPARRPRSARTPAPPTLASASGSTSGALEALLGDLGSQIRRGPSQEATEAPQLLATGLADLDAQLGGGFPCGRLSEICGAPSSGRTSLALRLLSETLERGLLAAWVDLADAFDPSSAAASGVDLDHLLWVRPRRLEEALRSCERLLRTEGFELVVLDLSLPGMRAGARPTGAAAASAPVVRDVTWLRLARLAASTRTALVALSGARTTGSRADLVLEMETQGARFVGPPSLLQSLETSAFLRRHRRRPTGARIPLSLRP
ncbi:MAG: hypothetical protein JRG86_09695 [Deltaproteobacteria bacterium]|jgi:hypothetical protein|nr:hypothetical protein [Deltaproteobacteria bacterium]MBW2500009.1 hypothetical protein [Deltaproteobacteria bacterium]